VETTTDSICIFGTRIHSYAVRARLPSDVYDLENESRVSPHPSIVACVVRV
jgi:hypothetical protein